MKVGASLYRNVSATWMAHAACLAIGFFMMPYVVGVLGDTSYGAWLFISSIAGYAGLLHFGLGGTVCRYVAKYHASQEWGRLNEVVSLVLGFYVAMAGLALAVAGGLAACAEMLPLGEAVPIEQARIAILLLGCNVAAGLIGSTFGGVLMGVRRYDLEQAIATAGDLVRFALIMLFLRREYGIVTIGTIYFGITAAESLAHLVLAFRLVPQLSPHWRHWKWSVFRECISFSSFAFLNTVASQLIYATDTVVIGVLLGPQAIVPYYIALRLCQFIRQPIQQIGEICVPNASALAGRGDFGRLRQLVLRVMGVAFLLTTAMLIGIGHFGSLLIEVWMGPHYPISHRLLLLLFAAQVVALPVGVMRAVLFGMGVVRGPALLYLLEAVLNVVISVTLCQWLGLWGIAIGTVVPVLAIELGLLLPVGLKELQITRRALFQEALWPAVLPLLGLLLYAVCVHQCTYPHTWGSLVSITIGGGAVLGVIWYGCYKLQIRSDLRSAQAA